MTKLLCNTIIFLNKYFNCLGRFRSPADVETRGLRQAVPHSALSVSFAKDPLVSHPSGKCNRVSF
jgi:hypothetical protein